jgi:hypothetical protein
MSEHGLRNICDENDQERAIIRIDTYYLFFLKEETWGNFVKNLSN